MIHDGHNVGILKTFTKHINIDEVNVLLELGARDGLYTKEFLDFYKPTILHSIDANPELTEIILNNQKDLANVKYTNIALSDTIGNVDFWVHPDQGSSSLYKHPKDYNRKITVEATTLDKFCSDNNLTSIDLIMADVEGAEAQIFKNQEILKTVKYIITEVKFEPSWKGLEFPGIDKLEEALEPAGFKLIETLYHPSKYFGDQLWIREK